MKKTGPLSTAVEVPHAAADRPPMSAISPNRIQANAPSQRLAPALTMKVNVGNDVPRARAYQGTSSADNP